MLVNLAYGRTGLSVEFPDDRTTVIEPAYLDGLPDQTGAVREAIARPLGTGPLRGLVSAGQTVAISVCDVTRPMPSSTVLPPVLEALAHVPDAQIAILVASGTHRATTHDELVEILGRRSSNGIASSCTTRSTTASWCPWARSTIRFRSR